MNEFERSMLDATDVFVLSSAQGDFAAAIYGTQPTLVALAAGDVVDNVVVDTRTAVVGPSGTPTLSVGVTGALTQFTGATSIVATGTAASNGTLYNTPAGGKNLVYDLENGGGNGAAATAGEIWIYVQIRRQSERTTNIKG